MNIKIRNFYKSELVHEMVQYLLISIISMIIVYSLLYNPKVKILDSYKNLFMISHVLGGSFVFLMTRELSKVVWSNSYSILFIFGFTTLPLIIASQH